MISTKRKKTSRDFKVLKTLLTQWKLKTLMVKIKKIGNDHNSKENIDKAATKMRGNLCDLGHSRTKNRRRIKVMVCMRTWTTES